MKVSLKVMTFFTIAILLVFSYKKATHAAGTTIAKIYGMTTTASFNNTKGVVPPRVGGTASVANLYTLIQKNSRSADFIVTDAQGTRSLGGANSVLGKNWQTKMRNANAVILRQGDFMDPKSIPSNLGNQALAPSVKNFINWFMANYRKITLYFNYPSDAAPKYRLYIADPNPGDVKIMGTQIMIPAYTNVLSKWNVGN